jgi:hypothetical protein
MGLLVALLLTLQEYVSYLIANYQYDFSWFSISTRNVISFMILTLLSPIAANGAQFFSGKNQKSTNRLILIVLISLLIAIMHRAFGIVLHNLIYSIYAGNETFNMFGFWKSRYFGAGIISSLIYYWILVSIFLAAISRTRLINKEKELANARLHALITQLRPHFLFNTLNSISSLIDIDKSAAQKMISRFGDLLRGVLEKEEKQFISLEEEVAFIENYLSIELERYQDRLSITYDLDPESLEGKVPTLILQPLVENAIKHGISKKLEGGEIAISSQILNGEENPVPQLELRVEDNGEGLIDGFDYGVGLKNVSKRLKELYQDDFEFKLENNEPEGCRARITIPIINE